MAQERRRTGLEPSPHRPLSADRLLKQELSATVRVIDTSWNLHKFETPLLLYREHLPCRAVF
jgi:hypothetical protein